MDDLALRLTLERRLRVSNMCHFIASVHYFVNVTCYILLRGYLIVLCLFIFILAQLFVISICSLPAVRGISKSIN